MRTCKTNLNEQDLKLLENVEGATISQKLRNCVVRATSEQELEENENMSANGQVEQIVDLRVEKERLEDKLADAEKEVNVAKEDSNFWFKDSEEKDSEIQALNGKISGLQADRDRLLACAYCKPALDYLVGIINHCEIQNFPTTFDVEMKNALIGKYEKQPYLQELCSRLSKAYGKTITPENFGKVNLEDNLTGFHIPR